MLRALTPTLIQLRLGHRMLVIGGFRRVAYGPPKLLNATKKVKARKGAATKNPVTNPLPVRG